MGFIYNDEFAKCSIFAGFYMCFEFLSVDLVLEETAQLFFYKQIETNCTISKSPHSRAAKLKLELILSRTT